MKPGLLIILFFCLFSITVQSYASEIPNDTTYIFLKDYGLYKTRKKNAIKYFYKALEDLKTDQPKVLVFSTGTYHFYSDGCVTKVYSEGNPTDDNPKVCAFYFENIKNLVIDGRGSHLIFHQEMQPFTFDNCQNITLKNLSMDWEQPLVAQAEVIRINDQYMDIGLDPKETPYRLIEGKIFFDVANGQYNEWNSTLEFDRKGRFIVPHTGEVPCLGEHWNAYHAEATMPGIVRLHFAFERKPQIGNYLIMSHAKASHSGIFINESENTEINNVRMFHAVGQGILASNSKNLTFDRYQAIPNRSKNRYFSGLAEGLAIANCQGKIDIKNSTFQGLMSDAIVSYDSAINADKIVSENQLRELIIERNNFNSCRGAGIVVSTSDKVKIENNIFETSGSAILIDGEFDKIPESSAITDLEILNNTFNSYCNSSTYNLNEAIISISPNDTEIKEQSLTYHKNINIQNNNFYPFDYPIIYALSVNGLTFTNNKVTQSFDILPYNDREYNFSFEFCKNITVMNNEFSTDVLGKNMLLKKTPLDQLKTDLSETFKIERY